MLGLGIIGILPGFPMGLCCPGGTVMLPGGGGPAPGGFGPPGPPGPIGPLGP